VTYTWNKEKRRYIDANGKTVASSTVRAWVDALTVALALMFMGRAMKVQIGDLDPTDWNREMSDDITSLHYGMAAAALGGVTQMSNDDWLDADKKIQSQQSFFAQLTSGVLSSAIPLDGQFVQRNGLYALAGFSTYENTVVNREFGAGLNLYRRVLDPSAENCVDCIDYAKMGWQTRAQIPEIGMSLCKVRCRCHWAFKTGTLDEIGRAALRREEWLIAKYQRAA
jgi:hypothetical protein